ncbi:spondin domain-containing protein [Nitrosopumilus sp.]|uniref:spondin domain-containing protein n=1 Tax=Nitrosopumilus sp. TaxID=2024843 RepID=UPI00260D718F|nr:spondin domain-containing protein [Nitrosopumilus sp.]
MKSKKTGFFAMTALVAILAVGIAGIPESNAAKSQMYEVTITNITPGQPITPPLLVTHSKDVSLFTVGEKASEELQQLAENGNSNLLVEKIEGKSGVMDIVKGSGGHLVPANDPGDTDLQYSETFTVSADGNKRYLSFASMLVCTNDGIAGIDSVKLPFYKEKTVYAKAYDVRTEMNTEDFADLVPPCAAESGVSSSDKGTGATNPAIAEDGIITPHPGIFGDDDLSQRAHGWDGPVVKIDIVRMN